MNRKHDLQGLSAEQVIASRAAHGNNVLTARERTPWWKKFAIKFTDPLILILLVAAVLSMGIALYEYYGLHEPNSVFLEPIGIAAAILLATGLAFWFEWRAEREFSLLNQQNDAIPVRVIRSGHETQVARSELVVGDLVLLATGDEIPADGELIQATQMLVDESTLTGEPVCRKSALAEEADPDATFPTNMVLRGTKILEGHGLLRVTAVGDATEHGRVFTQVQIDSGIRTPLNEQLDRLGTLISRASYAFADLIVVGRIVMWTLLSPSADLFSVAFLTYFLQSIMMAVTLIVVSVPEGLPMAVTLSLAYSMRRMLKTQNLVRRMHACETMGAATVICTDKTGTLTQNQMRIVDMKEVNSNKGGENISSLTSSHIALNMAVNSTASLDGNTVLGNPTEGALLLWLQEKGINYLDLRSAAHVTEEIPFTTERKYMGTKVDDIWYLKGAPEIVIAKCPSLSSDLISDLNRQLLVWQQHGLRTLALAHGSDLEQTLLDAIIAIADPVRADVPAAVAECLRAGIAVKIVTGDTPATAMEIAHQIGLPKGSVMTGPEVAALSDDELKVVADKISVIARAKPLDKQRLVQALQNCGQVVAVTGDGTNDAPALKAAHVGLSMGDGTAVAKEASDITILDNSFASIGRAVLWGRSLYRNIQRFILFQMTVNVCACFTVLAGTFMGTEAPLTVPQMLWVNLIMDTFAAMALASLPPSQTVMHERPRDRRRFIISSPMWHFILIIGGLFFLLMSAMLWALEHAQVDSALAFISILSNDTPWDYDGLSITELSLFFTTFVMLQLWNLFNARAFLTGQSAFLLKNCQWFLLIVGLILVGQILIVQFGGMMFGVVPLKMTDWGVIILATSPVLLLGELARILKRLLFKR